MIIYHKKEVVYNPEFKTIDHGMVTVGVGTTLWAGRRSVQVMSDMWESVKQAAYWDENTNRIITIDIGTNAGAMVDVTDEVLQSMREYFENYFYDKEITVAQDTLTRTFEKGDPVKVVSGRNHKGLVGFICAKILKSYNTGWKSNSGEWKVAIPLSDKKVTVEKYGRTYENYAEVAWVWQRNIEHARPKTLSDEVRASKRETAKKTAEAHVRGIQTYGP